MDYESLASHVIGFTQIPPNFGTNTLTATGAASPVAYPAYGFTALETGTLMTVSLYATGAGSNNVKASLYLDDGTGKPVSTGAIAGSEGPALAIVNNDVNTFQLGTGGAGVAVTAGTRYHVVFKSYTAGQNPNFSYSTVGYPHTSLAQSVGGSTCSSATTADTWGSVAAGRAGVIYTMASGNRFGSLYAIQYSGYVANTSGREFGARFISPPVWFAIDALSIALHKAGTVAGNVTLKLYVNGVLRATSAPFRAECLSTTVGSVACSIPRTVIPPNSICRVVWAASIGETASNYLRSNRLIKLANVTGASSVFPLSTVQTSSVDGGAWVDDPAYAPWFCLIGSFQAGPEILPEPLNRRQFNAMR